MAKADLNILLDQLSGRISGDSQYYTTHRYGRTIISNYPLYRDPKKTTASQRANSNAFAQAAKLCKQEMDNPDRLSYWTERYALYRKAASRNLSKANLDFFGMTNGIPNVPSDKFYITLRGFVIGQLRLRQRDGE